MEKDIISIRDMTREDIDKILKRARSMDKITSSSKLKGKILALLFFEPSTRTLISFKVAMARLGGNSIEFNERYSSIEKGESFPDTLKVIDSYADIIVIRHPLAGSARLAAEIAEHPVINAGDGANQHPTQTLLDLYTIQKIKGKIDDSRIALVGDLKYGRTVHSLAYALAMYGADITFISPDSLKMPRFVTDEIKKKFGVDTKDKTKIEGDYDIIYMTRIQKERFGDPLEYEKVRGSYRITPEIVHANTFVMHPLPRIDEIDPRLDKTKNAIYFEQAAFGVPIRMALIDLLMNV